MAKLLVRKDGKFLEVDCIKDCIDGYCLLEATDTVIEPSSLCHFGTENQECRDYEIPEYYQEALKKAETVGADYVHSSGLTRTGDYGNKYEGTITMYLKK